VSHWRQFKSICGVLGFVLQPSVNFILNGRWQSCSHSLTDFYPSSASQLHLNSAKFSKQSYLVFFFTYFYCSKWFGSFRPSFLQAPVCYFRCRECAWMDQIGLLRAWDGWHSSCKWAFLLLLICKFCLYLQRKC